MQTESESRYTAAHDTESDTEAGEHKAGRPGSGVTGRAMSCYNLNEQLGVGRDEQGVGS